VRIYRRSRLCRYQIFSTYSDDDDVELHLVYFAANAAQMRTTLIMLILIDYFIYQTGQRFYRRLFAWASIFDAMPEFCRFISAAQEPLLQPRAITDVLPAMFKAVYARAMPSHYRRARLIRHARVMSSWPDAYAPQCHLLSNTPF